MCEYSRRCGQSTITDPTMVTDPDPKAFVVQDEGEILYADGMFCALVGAGSRERVVGQQLSEFLAPESQGVLTEQVARIADGDAPALGLQVTLERLDGESRGVVALNSRVEWDGAERIQTSFLNVAGPEPDSGVELRDYAMEEAPIGITMADVTEPDEPLIYVNDGFVEMTGYEREAALGRNCRFLQGELTQEEPVAKMRAAIEAEEAVTVELRNYRQDGTMFWNRVHIVPVELPSGAVKHYLGFQEDITESKLHEHEKTLFEKQAEVSDQAMFITDREGTIQYVNPAFEHSTGYSASEAVGRNPRILKSGQQDEAFYEELWQTITAGDVWEAELTNESKDGQLYEARQTIVPITDEEGTVTNFAAIESDITDRVIKTQTLNVLNRVLRHNLRTAITVIEGQAELLESDQEFVDVRTAVSAIKKQTTSMRKIADKTARIDNLIESDGNGIVWDRSHLASIVASYREQYPDATISLTVETEGTLALPNAKLFELALDEAVENAVEHADSAPVTVDITLSERADHVEITVADDGPGIPENERAAIESGEERPLTHSTGIGLWIIEWVTTRIGGEFQLTDNEPRGSVLRFRLPVVRNRAED